jgi:hypothetical protein
MISTFAPITGLPSIVETRPIMDPLFIPEFLSGIQYPLLT